MYIRDGGGTIDKEEISSMVRGLFSMSQVTVGWFSQSYKEPTIQSYKEPTIQSYKEPTIEIIKRLWFYEYYIYCSTVVL